MLLIVLFLSALLVAGVSWIITKSLVIAGTAMVFSFGFGCIGGLIAPYVQSWLRNKIIDGIELTLLSVADGRKKYKINKQRYEDLHFEQNVIVFQSVLALIGVCMLFVTIYKYLVLYFVILGFFIFLLLYLVYYYKMIKNDIYNDLINRL